MKKVLVSLVLTAIFVASSWSFFRSGFFLVHDYVHAARIAEMLRALQEGQFPVRWSSNFGYGYGMPLFEFYAPLPYYAGALLYWLGFPILMTLRILFAASSFFTMIGAYKLGSKLYGRSGGLLVAAALTLAPYRAVNLFVRGALAEAWGMMALPWIMLGVVQVVRKEKSGWVVLTLSLVVLMLSHNITTMLFVPVSFAIGLSYWLITWINKSKKAKEKFWEVPVKLMGSYLLAVGLSAFYLFPALVEKGYTHVENILSGYFHYSQHFLYIRQFFTSQWGYGGSGWGPDDGMSFFLGYGQLFGIGIVLLLCGWSLWPGVKAPSVQKVVHSLQEFRVWWLGLMTLTFGLSIFMTLLRSKVVWDAVPFLSFVQFPWRFLALAALFLSLTVGAIPTFIKDNFKRLLLTTVLLILIIEMNSIYFRPVGYLEHPESYYYTAPQLIQSNMSSILPDYIPLGMGDIETPPKELFLVPLGLDKKVEVLVNRGHEKLFKTAFANDIVMSVAVADFPGWKIEIDGQPVEKAASQITGSLAVQVPPGEHLVGLRFDRSPIRLISDLLSLGSFVVLCYLLSDVTSIKNQITTHD